MSTLLRHTMDVNPQGGLFFLVHSFIFSVVCELMPLYSWLTKVTGHHVIISVTIPSPSKKTQILHKLQYKQ